MTYIKSIGKILFSEWVFVLKNGLDTVASFGLKDVVTRVASLGLKDGLHIYC